MERRSSLISLPRVGSCTTPMSTGDQEYQAALAIVGLGFAGGQNIHENNMNDERCPTGDFSASAGEEGAAKILAQGDGIARAEPNGHRRSFGGGTVFKRRLIGGATYNFKAYVETSDRIQNCALLMVALSYFGYKSSRWPHQIANLKYMYHQIANLEYMYGPLLIWRNYLSSWVMYSGTSTVQQYGRFVGAKKPMEKFNADKRLYNLIKDLQEFALRGASKQELKECRSTAIQAIETINQFLCKKITKANKSNFYDASFQDVLLDEIVRSMDETLPRVQNARLRMNFGRILQQDVYQLTCNKEGLIENVSEINGEIRFR